MSTTKAKKFRIRRSLPIGGGDEASATPTPRRPLMLSQDDYVDDGLGAGTRAPAQPSRPQRPAPSGQALVEDEKSTLGPAGEIDQIKAEGLTGRQLRMARRIAERHGIEAASDLDAVRLLRQKGIDPFQRENMLELVVSDQEQEPRLPTTFRQPRPPSTEVIDGGARASEIMQIQRDLVRRRRRRLWLLVVRLFFFVALPTLLAGYYYANIATKMYSTRSEFVIQQANAQSASPVGGLFSGTAFATSQDSITVQSYLQSRDAMLRLNNDHDFKAHFQQPVIDPLQRLEPTGSNEAAYRLYKRNVKIGYDQTEGIIKMEVIAASPAASVEFANALIGYAEEQVDSLTERLRKDQMRGARESYEESEAKMIEAQRRVLELQERRGVLSADLEVTSVMTQISQFEVQIKTNRLELAELLDNPRPNATKVEVARKQIARLESLVADMRAEMTEGDNNQASLAKISGELVIAQADLETRQLMLSQSLQQLETARIEANRQVRYLSMGVSPVAPDEATYPRVFENTVLAFLVFGGLYLMLSLTASILREQVSA